jgi:hypothetical protein
LYVGTVVLKQYSNLSNNNLIKLSNPIKILYKQLGIFFLHLITQFFNFYIAILRDGHTERIYLAHNIIDTPGFPVVLERMA